MFGRAIHSKDDRLLDRAQLQRNVSEESIRLSIPVKDTCVKKETLHERIWGLSSIFNTLNADWAEYVENVFGDLEVQQCKATENVSCCKQLENLSKCLTWWTILQ